MLTEDRRFGLYVHWPFCQAKCPYCDFNSHVVRAVDHDAWTAALVAELASYEERLPGRTLTSIYFGGGTPSLMKPATVGAVIDRAVKAWKTSDDVEITLEANPTSVEMVNFEGYASAGVNRVSVGVQSLDQKALRSLGRLHSVDDARHAVALAQTYFNRVNLDLIYARQDQTVAEWETELLDALSLGTDHLSLYQLTIEPNTAFAERFARGGLRGLPDEDLAADLYTLTQTICQAAGMPRYEISNHARRGSESVHNMTYWDAHDWIGIGPGAHGRFTENGTRIATTSVSQPDRWLKSSIEERTSAAAIDTEEEFEVATMMGLRTRDGVSLPGDAKILKEIREFVSLELLWMTNARYGVTDSGALVLNEILRKLLA